MMTAALTPNVLWAQCRDKIYLTIELQDCVAPLIDLTENSVAFEGIARNKNYQFNLPLLHEVHSWIKNVTSRNILLIATKKEILAEFWPRVYSGQKLNWIKVYPFHHRPISRDTRTRTKMMSQNKMLKSLSLIT
jgi:hypothetical protein